MEMMEAEYDWQTADGKKLKFTEMTTDHLLNVYKHILNNFDAFVKHAVGPFPNTATPDYLDLAKEKVKNRRLQIKCELLKRGVDEDTIENHVENYIQSSLDSAKAKKEKLDDTCSILPGGSPWELKNIKYNGVNAVMVYSKLHTQAYIYMGTFCVVLNTDELGGAIKVVEVVK